MLSDKLSTRIAIDAYGQVAQLVEQRTENPRAEGSSPPLTTINNREPSGSRFVFLGSSWRVRSFMRRCTYGSFGRLGVRIVCALKQTLSFLSLNPDA